MEVNGMDVQMMSREDVQSAEKQNSTEAPCYLKPCPFCGECVKDNDFYKKFDTWDDHGVERELSYWVMECCLTFVFSSHTKEVAQKEWNLRR